jgi:acetylornithine deacetylase/succinyl-diaminopimelate desuccinylase-like protein
MMLALEAIVRSGTRLHGDLILISPGDGEAEFDSSFLIADTDLASEIDWIISGEPTGPSEIGTSYLGSSLWRVTVRGRAAHATQPEEGINAISQTARVVLAIEEGRLTFQHATHEHFTPFAVVHGVRNRAHAEIPDECTFIMIVFSVPGMALGGIKSDIERFLRELPIPGLQAGVGLVPRETHMWLPPLDEPKDSPVVTALRDSAERVAGVRPDATKMRIGYVSAAAMATRARGRGASTPVAVTFGPGDYRKAHTVNESIAVEDVARFAEIYAETALQLLGEGGPGPR